MADCYPSDFNGPLPPGGYYCDANVPTVFGQINSWIAQAAGTAAQIRNTLNTYQGTTTKQPAYQPTNAGHTTVALLFFAVVVGLIIWLIVRNK